MCIAIFKPAEATIGREILECCEDSNRDGFGFAVASGGLHYRRYPGRELFETFCNDLAMLTNGKPAIVHFRIATHGPVTLENCHPFAINKGLAMIHNGIIDTPIQKNQEHLSDTWHYTANVLRKLPAGFERSEGTIELIRRTIGWSRMVFLDRTGRHTIINEQSGIWEQDGCWYSNNSYKPSRYTWADSSEDGPGFQTIDSWEYESCDSCSQSVKFDTLADVGGCAVCPDCCNAFGVPLNQRQSIFGN